MAIICTIKDKNNNFILSGQVFDVTIKNTGDYELKLSKIHSPFLHEITSDGFHVPCDCRICKNEHGISS